MGTPRRTQVSFSLLVVCLLIPAWHALAQSGSEEARAAIAQGYEQLDQATEAKDASIYARVLAPDAKIVSGGFEFGVIEFQAMLSNVLPQLAEASQKTEIVELKFAGNSAAVTARSRVRMVSKGADGKSSVIEANITASDSWRLTGEGWRIARSVEVSRLMWIDGVEQGTVAPVSAAEREAIVGDLRTVSRPFSTTEPGSGLDDLAFLEDFVGDARIVALGESSHGSSEQFKMKHRIIQYLVARKGFTVVAFEANWSSAGTVDSYVKGGSGTAVAGLERLGYWVWRTEEVRGLLEWMRKENSSRTGEKLLSFAGFDIQQQDVPSDCVLDAFAKIGGSDVARLRKLYGMDGDAKTSAAPSSAQELEALLRDVRARTREALEIVDARRADLVAAGSELAYQKARQCARVIVQNADNLDAGFSTTVRDQAMADNVRWLADVAHPGEKIILWAHNLHVGVNPGLMGGHLRQAFGKSMVVVGFASHHGEIRASPIKDGKVDGELYSVVGPIPIPLAATAESSVDDILNAAGLPRFFLDLNRVPQASALGQWLAKPQSETSIGWPYDPTKANVVQNVLPETYDGIIFIAKTSATVLLK